MKRNKKIEDSLISFIEYLTLGDLACLNIRKRVNFKRPLWHGRYEKIAYQSEALEISGAIVIACKLDERKSLVLQHFSVKNKTRS